MSNGIPIRDRITSLEVKMSTVEKLIWVILVTNLGLEGLQYLV